MSANGMRVPLPPQKDAVFDHLTLMTFADAFGSRSVAHIKESMASSARPSYKRGMGAMRSRSQRKISRPKKV
jgi:hypothetical protein